MLNISIETNTKLTQAEQTKYAQYEEREDRKAFLVELEKANQGSQPAQSKKQDTNNNSASAHTQPQKHAVNNSETENAQSKLDKQSGTESSIESKPLASSKQLREVEKGHNAVVKEQVHSTYGERKPEQLQEETDTASGSFDPDTPVGLDTSSFPKKMPKELEEALKFYKPISPDLPKPISADVPKAIDEKLGLDDSHIPVGEDNGVFEQIQASKKQTTDVQHNLEPVSNMLKDVLAQFKNKGEKVAPENTDPKQDIAPPNLDGKETDAESDEPVAKSDSDAPVFDKSHQPIDRVWPDMGKGDKTSSEAQIGNEKVQTQVHAQIGNEKVQTQTQAQIGIEKVQTQAPAQVGNEKVQVQSQTQLGNEKTQTTVIAPNKSSIVNTDQVIPTAQVLGKGSPASSELEENYKYRQDNSTGQVQGDKFRKGMDQEGPIKGEPISATSSTIKPTESSDKQANRFSNTKVAATEIHSQAKVVPEVKISAEGQVTAKLDAAQLQTTNAQSNQVTSEKFVGKEQNVQPKALLNQVNTLSHDEKVQLKQFLQHAIDGGQLKPQQLKEAEQVLATLKEVEKAPEQSAKFTLDKVSVSNNGNQTNTNSAAKPEGADSYNSTKVTAQTVSESAQKSEQNVKVAVEQHKSAEQVKQMEPAQVTTKAPVSAQVEQVFRSITQQPLPNVQADLHNVDLVQSAQQFDTAVQTAQSQQSVTSSQRAQLEANLAQPINIQRNDAVKALQEKVNMMLNINNKEAEIRLDPPELGSMQIRIRSEGEQAQVNFVVQNQQAKEALEQSMPKLKEMLAEQGIQLGESNIQQDNGSSNEQGFEQSQHTDNSRLANQDVPEQNSQQTNAKASSDGSGIDYYA